MQKVSAAMLPKCQIRAVIGGKRLETGPNFYGIYTIQSSSHIVWMVLQIYTGKNFRFRDFRFKIHFTPF